MMTQIPHVLQEIKKTIESVPRIGTVSLHKTQRLKWQRNHKSKLQGAMTRPSLFGARKRSERRYTTTLRYGQGGREYRASETDTLRAK